MLNFNLIYNLYSIVLLNLYLKYFTEFKLELNIKLVLFGNI